MHKINNAKTLEKNYLKKFQHLIYEYELVKKGQHPRYKFVSDFSKTNGSSLNTTIASK